MAVLAVDRQSPGEPARRLLGISAERMGAGPRTSAQGRVPKEMSFKTKPRIALEQLQWACAAGLRRGVV